MIDSIKKIASLGKRKGIRRFLRKFTFILFISIFLLLLFKQVIAIFLTVFLLILGSISKLYKRITHYSLGFELITFATIIFFFTHGIILGMLLCLLMMGASTLLSGKFSQLMIFQAATYLFLGIVSLFLRGTDIAFAGKILVILYNLITHFIGLFLLGYPFHSSLVNFAVNVGTNFLLFNTTAQWLVENL